MRALAAVIGVVVLGACADGELRPEAADRQDAIIGGTVTTDLPAVMMLVAYSTAQGSYETCSSVLIAPGVLLTAAHCIDPQYHGDEMFGVYVGPDASAYTTVSTLVPRLVAVSATYVHPSYDRNAPFTADIGVALLATPSTVTPLPFNRTALTSSLDGAAARIVGYGQTTYGQYHAIREVASTSVVSVDSDTVVVGDSQRRSCVGDSGGPALVTFGGVETVVGVDSYTDLTGCVGPAHYRRTDSYVPFIEQYLPVPVDAGTGGGSGAGTGGGSSAGTGGGSSAGTGGGSSAGTGGGSSTGTGGGSSTGTGGGSSAGMGGGSSAGTGGGSSAATGGGSGSALGGGSSAAGGGDAAPKQGCSTIDGSALVGLLLALRGRRRLIPRDAL